MKLSQLLSIYGQLRLGQHPLVDVAGITSDSRQATKDFVFVAVRGTKIDGHQFIEEVAKKSIAALIVEDDASIPKNFEGAVVKVDDTRWALETLANRFYGEPANEMFCMGVTGTNGKTTICHLVEKILTQAQIPTGVMGTVDHHLRDKIWPSELTTPDPVTFYRRLQEFKSLGAKAVALEVSSHALTQSRVDSLPFDVAVFTNLTRDHLDFHQTMENYFSAKQRLFNQLLSRSKKTAKFAIVNYDDEWGRKLEVAGDAKLWTYGQTRSDFQFSIEESDFNGSIFQLDTPRGPAKVNIPLIGLHNVYNAVASLAVGVSAGASLPTCVEALRHAKGAPGRLERVFNKSGIHVFVDYAHSNDALENVLGTIHRIRGERAKKAKIITVFGCGGDRDQGKRPLMGAIAEKYSDTVVVTSDNPRTEDPEKIISEISRGFAQIGKKIIKQTDRRQAITEALNLSQQGDIVLIAGKGHEDYQILGTKKIHFSDQEVVKEVLGCR